jgi:hypothetical protein
VISRFFFFGLILTFSSGLWQYMYAQKSMPELNISRIPNSLLKTSTEVVRSEMGFVEILSKSKFRFRYRKVITILNRKSTRVYIPYGEFTDIKSVSAFIYDSEGQQKRKIKNSDIVDRASYDGFSIASDGRYKAISINNPQVPFTLVYEYEITSENPLFLPDWWFQSDENQAVEYSEFKVQLPASLNLNFRVSRKKDVEMLHSENEGIKEYTWTVKNMMPTDYELLGPSPEAQFPTIYLSLSDFEIDGYKGSASNWTDLGLFFYVLNDQRQSVSEKKQQEVLDLTSSLNSKEEKVAVIYNHLQENTRYVSVQLGIGGWQTFPANYVEENGYGDCKALSNYTRSLLQVAGIESFYTLVEAGKYPKKLSKEFPNSYFNHAILCVPNGSDSIWLECTSQNQPFNYLGSFTSNRKALLITPQGGVLTNTQRLTKEDNTTINNLRINLQANGDTEISCHNSYIGLASDKAFAQLRRSDRDRKESIYKEFDFQDFEVISCAYSDNKTKMPSISETIEIEMEKFGTKSGSRLYLNFPDLNRNLNLDLHSDERNRDIEIRFGGIIKDSVLVKIPKGFIVEFLPKNQHFSNEFGICEYKFISEKDQLFLIKTIEWNSGTYPSKKYDELKELIYAINNSSRERIVLYENID